MSTSEFWKHHYTPIDPNLQTLFLGLGVEDCAEILKDIGTSSAGGIACDSAENRVFCFDQVVIKFYRPGRWRTEALEEEVRFLEDLREENVPFVRPVGGLKIWRGIPYLAFEKVPVVGPQNPEVLNEESVRQMVQLVAQIHDVGAKRPAPARPQFDPRGMCDGCFEVMQKAGFLPAHLYSRYAAAMNELVAQIEAIGDVPIQRIHGDTYSGNVLWTAKGPVFMDLDDFQVGPVAIDVKLLSFPWCLNTLPPDMDKRERRKIQHQLVLDTYREVRPFPTSREALFPLVSAYRDIQFDAWFSARWNEPGFAKNYPDDNILDERWWVDSVEGLESLLSR